MEEELEGAGTLKVTRWGACSSFKWDIQWTSVGGNHPQMEVNGTNIVGYQATLSISTLKDGHMFMDAIPGEFLRVPSKTPQVLSYNGPNTPLQ